MTWKGAWVILKERLSAEQIVTLLRQNTSAPEAY